MLLNFLFLVRNRTGSKVTGQKKTKQAKKDSSYWAFMFYVNQWSTCVFLSCTSGTPLHGCNQTLFIRGGSYCWAGVIVSQAKAWRWHSCQQHQESLHMRKHQDDHCDLRAPTPADTTSVYKRQKKGMRKCMTFIRMLLVIFKFSIKGPVVLEKYIMFFHKGFMKNLLISCM